MTQPASQNPLDILAVRMRRACQDAELARLGPGLDVRVRLSDGAQHLDLRLSDGVAEINPHPALFDIEIAAARDDWAMLVSAHVPPTFHAFTALQLANPAFTVSGDALAIARARPMLERLFELSVVAARGDVAAFKRDLSSITGRYRTVEVAGTAYSIYLEEAGADAGTPVVFLHTAGADSRQFHGQLSDLDLARSRRMIAFDLPFHGRSMPPESWDGGVYRLSKVDYLAWVEAFIEQISGDKVILAGCSMGAAMALTVASERPDLVSGVIAIEPPFRARGRKNAQQHHVAVHGNLHNASFVRGLMSPVSPAEHRRHASWIYSQGAPGIYPGDLSFYSEEFDGETVASTIDTDRTPVALLCGSYDYSASPADGRKLQALMPAAHFEEMPTLGHFPMTEDPDAFRPYLHRALAHVQG